MQLSVFLVLVALNRLIMPQCVVLAQLGLTRSQDQIAKFVLILLFLTQDLATAPTACKDMESISLYPGKTEVSLAVLYVPPGHTRMETEYVSYVRTVLQLSDKVHLSASLAHLDILLQTITPSVCHVMLELSHQTVLPVNHAQMILFPQEVLPFVLHAELDQSPLLLE